MNWQVRKHKQGEGVELFFGGGCAKMLPARHRQLLAARRPPALKAWSVARLHPRRTYTMNLVSAGQAGPHDRLGPRGRPFPSAHPWSAALHGLSPLGCGGGKPSPLPYVAPDAA